MIESSSFVAQRDAFASHRESHSFAVQPSLLDRLTLVRAPAGASKANQPYESTEHYTPPRTALRDAILRDLTWLLNSTRLEALMNLDAYPHVQRSVANFGVAGLAGRDAPANGWTRIEHAIREAIMRFEPRMLADNVEVRCLAEPREPCVQRRSTCVELEISGQWWTGDTPQSFLLRAGIDFERHCITLRAPGSA